MSASRSSSSSSSAASSSLSSDCLAAAGFFSSLFSDADSDFFVSLAGASPSPNLAKRSARALDFFFGAAFFLPPSWSACNSSRQPLHNNSVPSSVCTLAAGLLTPHQLHIFFGLRGVEATEPGFSLSNVITTAPSRPANNISPSKSTMPRFLACFNVDINASKRDEIKSSLNNSPNVAMDRFLASFLPNFLIPSTKTPMFSMSLSDCAARA
mmetsp:Transcript_5882/g.10029  ORF Transcript_5882/g.10029 Transcript_5882/m.10029 type:complete len:211 (-) Transcript_5882:620-1252(-)